jgi:LmbE family N-acetylglucosaminyl deacetylase
MSVVFVSPHIDDETISGGVLNTFYASHGHNVVIAYMNRGGNGGPSGQLSGTQPCVRHGRTHDPVREFYSQQTMPFLPADIGNLRIAEGRSIVGALDTMPPLVQNGSGMITPGAVNLAEGNLPDLFGGAAGQPPTEEGIDAAYDVIVSLANQTPNSIFITMSEHDPHPDHAACGIALRRAINEGVVGSAARFVVTPNLWDTTTAYPANRALVYAHNPTWFDPGMYFPAARTPIREFARNTLAPIYDSWNPAGGSYAVGYHQVYAQFLKVYGIGKTPAVLWYA